MLSRLLIRCRIASFVMFTSSATCAISCMPVSNVVVGDADGADTSIQECLYNFQANKVTVNCTGDGMCDRGLAAIVRTYKNRDFAIQIDSHIRQAAVISKPNIAQMHFFPTLKISKFQTLFRIDSKISSHAGLLLKTFAEHERHHPHGSSNDPLNHSNYSLTRPSGLAQLFSIATISPRPNIALVQYWSYA